MDRTNWERFERVEHITDDIDTIEVKGVNSDPVWATLPIATTKLNDN